MPLIPLTSTPHVNSIPVLCDYELPRINYKLLKLPISKNHRISELKETK